MAPADCSHTMGENDPAHQHIESAETDEVSLSRIDEETEDTLCRWKGREYPSIRYSKLIRLAIAIQRAKLEAAKDYIIDTTTAL